MIRLPFLKAKSFFSEKDKTLIESAIKEAETATSGEVRVYIENHCGKPGPLERARQMFLELKMQETAQRNGVLLYIALKDRKLAVYGDEGIHQKLGESYWAERVKAIIEHFSQKKHAEGIANAVREIGQALALHFPYDRTTDSNELSDEIVFGNN